MSKKWEGTLMHAGAATVAEVPDPAMQERLASAGRTVNQHAD